MKVITYGTLKKGFHNHYWMEKANGKFICNDKIKGEMFNVGIFPAIHLESNKEIFCEVYEVNEEGLKHLDRLEGYPELYKRKLVKTLENNYEGWVYYWDKEKLEGYIPIKNGNWTKV